MAIALEYRRGPSQWSTFCRMRSNSCDRPPLFDSKKEGILLQIILNDSEHIDVMRLAEIFWAATRIKELLPSIDLSAVKSVAIHSDESGKGIGIVEVPRGVLIQSYIISRGRFFDSGQKAIGRCTRLLDPCLTCAIH